MTSPATVQLRSWLPTRKWWAATVTALGAIAVLWLQEGAFTTAVGIAMVGATVQAVVTYLLPNDATPGGVPVRSG